VALIDTLSVSLVARTTKWSKGFKRARRDLDSFAGGLRKSAGVVAGFGAAILGVGSVAGLATFVKRQADAIEKTGSFAARLKVTTEELTALRFAAGQSEIEIGAFDMSIARMVKNTNDAVTGTGKAGDAFRDLGIDAASFAQLPLEQRIAILSDRFSQMTDAGRAAADAMLLFGRGGASMLQLLNQGPDAIQGLADQARRLGITFGSLDAAKIDEANDAIARLQSLATGAANAVAIALAPTIEGLAMHFEESALAGGSFGDKVTAALERVSSALQRMVGLMNPLQGVWHGFRSVVEFVSGIVLKSLAKIGIGLDRFVNAVPGLNKLIKVDRGEFDATNELADRFLDASSKSFEKAKMKLFDFSGGASGSSVKAFFDSVRAKAEQASTATKRVPVATLPEPARKLKLDPFAARSVNLRDIFIGALGGQGRKEQTVRDPQLRDTNNLLRTISRNLSPIAVS